MPLGGCLTAVGGIRLGATGGAQPRTAAQPRTSRGGTGTSAPYTSTVPVSGRHRTRHDRLRGPAATERELRLALAAPGCGPRSRLRVSAGFAPAFPVPRRDEVVTHTLAVALRTPGALRAGGAMTARQPGWGLARSGRGSCPRSAAGAVRRWGRPRQPGAEALPVFRMRSAPAVEGHGSGDRGAESRWAWPPRGGRRGVACRRRRGCGVPAACPPGRGACPFRRGPCRRCPAGAGVLRVLCRGGAAGWVGRRPGGACPLRTGAVPPRGDALVLGSGGGRRCDRGRGPGGARPRQWLSCPARREATVAPSHRNCYQF